MSVIDIKTGKLCDPDHLPKFVPWDEYNTLVIAHNGLVDAHNELVHKCALLEKKLKNSGKISWMRFW